MAMGELDKLVAKNRSYRRFYEDHEIDKATLVDLVSLACLSSSGRNLQPLKYFLSCDRALNAQIFPTLAWAGYLQDWDGPEESERPAAYIIMLVDRSLTSATPLIDQGIACQTILLRATEKGLGGCIIGSVKRSVLSSLLQLSENLEVALVIALGKPKEVVRIVEVKGGDIKYFRDSEGIHYVPKRSAQDCIVNP